MGETRGILIYLGIPFRDNIFPSTTWDRCLENIEKNILDRQLPGNDYLAGNVLSECLKKL